MASYKAELPTELIKIFQELDNKVGDMLGDMCQAGAETVKTSIKAKMPPALRAVVTDNDISLTDVYRTPSDDGYNVQVYLTGYFTNKDGKKTPIPLVANMFEYGSSSRKYPKKPFLRSSFNKSQIEKAMLKAQEKYIKEGNE